MLSLHFLIEWTKTLNASECLSRGTRDLKNYTGCKFFKGMPDQKKEMSKKNI